MERINDTPVLILAGGLGKRLRPITQTVPKPMVEVNGKPFLEWKIEHLKQHNLRNIILCVSYLGEIIEDYFGDGNDLGVNIQYSFEEEPLGTGGAIKNAEPFIKNNFMAMNGDTHIPVNLSEMINFHNSNKNPFTMVVAKASNPPEQELVEIEGAKVTKIHKRETLEHFKHLLNNSSPLINGGVYIIEKDILNKIPQGKNISLEREIFPLLIGKIYGFVHEGYIKDLTNIQSYKEIREDLKNGI